MMKSKIIRLVWIALIVIPLFDLSPATAQEVAVIKSSDIAPFEETLRGFKSVYNAQIKEFSITKTDKSTILAEVKRMRPDLIVVIGLDALLLVRGELIDIPIVFTMVLNPPNYLLPEYSNITGVSMNITADRQLHALLDVAPKIRRVGVVYDPQKTGYLLREAEGVARSKGIEIFSRSVKTAEKTPNAIKELERYIDALWMFPDSTVITCESIRYMLLFSFEHRIPLLAPSDKYVKQGALVALNIDSFDIGQQTGEIANKILSGVDIKEIPINSPRKVSLSINMNTAKSIGIKIHEKVSKEANLY